MRAPSQRPPPLGFRLGVQGVVYFAGALPHSVPRACGRVDSRVPGVLKFHLWLFRHGGRGLYAEVL